MKKYAELVGINFNTKKTGGVCVGGELEPSLPEDVVGWGSSFLMQRRASS